MAISKSPNLILLLLLTLTVAAEIPPIHDLLPTFGLPRGLLPDAVVTYSLSSNGDFVVELASTCYVHFPSNVVYYEKRITGKISYGKIEGISGIQAKKLFVWVSVTGIEVKGDEKIEFQVGFLSESLPMSEFEEVPACKSKVGCRGIHAALGEEKRGVAVKGVFQS